MAAGGILAALIGIRFGTSAQTDGLFAAYSLYGLLLMIAQSLRLTMVPRLTQTGSAASFIDGLGAIGVIALVSAGVLVGLGGPLATLLVGNGAAHDPAQTALIAFWAGATAQLVAGYHAARLAADGRFGITAVGYLVGSTLPVIALAAWPHPGVSVVSRLIASGAALTALTLVVAVWRTHGATRLPTLRGSLKTASQMVAGALGSVMWQIALVVSLGFAARLGEGDVTLYSYAFFAAGLITSVTSGSISMVIAGPLTADWDRGDPRPLEPALLGLVRTSTLLAVPLFGVALLVADDVIRLVLGGVLTDPEVTSMRDAFMAFGGLVVAASVSPVAALAVYARQRYWTLASIELCGLVAHIALTAVASTFDNVLALAVAAAITSWMIVLPAVWFVWGREFAPSLFGRIAVNVGRPVALGAALFVPLQLLAMAADSVLLAIVGAVAGVLAFAALARRLLPDYWAPIAGAIGSLVGR
jgi:peptidoglycan biosynthesis protein MviN/MurJ (putative lipid II flippase)